VAAVPPITSVPITSARCGDPHLAIALDRPRLADPIGSDDPARARGLAMRATAVLPILLATVIALASADAQARHLVRTSVILSRPSGARIIVMQRSHAPFAAFRHRRIDGEFGRSSQFAVVDGFVGGPAIIGAPALAAPAPPSVVDGAPRTPPPAAIGDLPPCHEVTASGVIIERGSACSRAAR
jgi:hypothetical protein